MRRPVKSVGVKCPNFDRLKLTSKNYDKNFWNAMHFAHNELGTERLKKETLQWCKENSRNIEHLESIDKWHFSTVGKVFFILNNGGEVTDDTYRSNLLALDRIEKDVLEANVEAVDAEPVEKKKPTVDRTLPEARVLMGIFDTWVDDYISGDISDICDKNYASEFELNAITHRHTTHIVQMCNNILPEYRAYITGLDSEIVEAYKYIGRKKVKHIVKFYTGVIAKCEELIDAHKVESLSSNKPPEEITKKLKYLKESSVLGLYSEIPADIIGASEVWIYNTKNRKIGYYKAKDRYGLSVKGSSILNYDENLSIEKSLFKPKDNIKGFKGKSIKAMHNSFDALTTIDTKCNGKITDKCIILKIE